MYSTFTLVSGVPARGRVQRGARDPVRHRVGGLHREAGRAGLLPGVGVGMARQAGGGQRQRVGPGRAQRLGRDVGAGIAQVTGSAGDQGVGRAVLLQIRYVRI